MKNKTIKIWTLTCDECSMTRAMQPCEACPNYNVQVLMRKINEN